jgi:hypothetical protein
MVILKKHLSIKSSLYTSYTRGAVNSNYLWGHTPYWKGEKDEFASSIDNSTFSGPTLIVPKTGIKVIFA